MDKRRGFGKLVTEVLLDRSGFGYVTGLRMQGGESTKYLENIVIRKKASTNLHRHLDW